QGRRAFRERAGRAVRNDVCRHLSAPALTRGGAAGGGTPPGAPPPLPPASQAAPGGRQLGRRICSLLQPAAGQSWRLPRRKARQTALERLSLPEHPGTLEKGRGAAEAAPTAAERVRRLRASGRSAISAQCPFSRV